MKLVRGEARKEIAFAISEGSAARPEGSKAQHAWNCSGVMARVIAVWVNPGDTELTAIWRLRKSMAMARVHPTTPALEAT